VLHFRMVAAEVCDRQFALIVGKKFFSLTQEHPDLVDRHAGNERFRIDYIVDRSSVTVVHTFPMLDAIDNRYYLFSAVSDNRYKHYRIR